MFTRDVYLQCPYISKQDRRQKDNEAGRLRCFCLCRISIQSRVFISRCVKLTRICTNCILLYVQIEDLSINVPIHPFIYDIYTFCVDIRFKSRGDEYMQHFHTCDVNINVLVKHNSTLLGSLCSKVVFIVPKYLLNVLLFNGLRFFDKRFPTYLMRKTVRICVL